MPQIYHAVPRCGMQGVPLALSLLIEDETNDLLRVFLEYEVRGEQQTLRLLPTDGYRGEDHYSLYSVEIPAAHLVAERFAYCFSIEGERTRAYEFPLVSGALASEGAVTAPAILPLCAPSRFRLSTGDLCLRFLTFPWDAERTRVLLREKGEWHSYDAALGENGEWECVLPITLLNELGGKLIYFVEVTGRDGSALLGNEREALSIRLVDDAGPTLTEIYPPDGETVAKNPPEVRIACKDASGIDRRTSVLYLDGRAVGKNAVWTANGMSFRPEKPLDDGEHVLEIVLRDTRGNYTYRRSVFRVVNAADEGKRSRSAVQAAGLLASAIVTLKKMFTDKD